MNPAPARIFVFQCSGNTYLGDIGKSLFGSNDPWPLQAKKGDHCLLHHYEYDTLFGLRRAASDGGRRQVPKALGGKFPFQTQVSLATPTILELPKGTVGPAERVVEGQRADQILQVLRSVASKPES